MSLNLDVVIIVGFLVVNLAIGLFSGRNISNIKEYTLGNRNFSTATIVATIAATWIGGSNFSITVAETYKQGIFFLTASLAEAVSFCIIAYIYAPRMGEFLGKLSIAEIMGEMYNSNYIRCITSAFSIIPAVGRVAMQFLVLQCLLNVSLGVSGIYATIISSLVIILYSAFGGIKSVTFTDLIQFFTFGVVMPMVAFIIWKSFANTDVIINAITQDPLFNYHLISDTQRQEFQNTSLLFLFLMVPIIDPAIFQRISMSRNTLQVSRACFIGVFFIIVCDALIHTVIGVLFRANVSITDLNADNVIQYVIDHYLTYGFKGIFVIGIMAMIMSTADSYINSSAVLLTNDFYRSLGINFTEHKQLNSVRISAVLIGCVSLFLSVFEKNLLDLLLSVYSFYMPIVTVPFTLAILGFRSTAKSLLIGMCAGFITVVYFEFFATKSGMISGIPGMLASALFFIGSHYLLKQSGGWVGIKDLGPLNSIRLERKRKIDRFIQSLKEFNLIRFCKHNTPKDESMFVYFGIFCIITILSHAYSLQRSLQEHYAILLNFVYYSVLTLSTVLITYTFWAEKFRNKEFISILWNITVFYNLVFCSSLLAIIGEFNQIQVIILMISLVSVAVIMRWQVALFMITTGVISSIKCYKLYVGIDYLPDYMHDLEFKITYSLILLSIVLIAFFKPKQQYQELAEDTNMFLSDKVEDQKRELVKLSELKNEFLRNLEHEAHTPITGITSMGQILDESYDKLTGKQKRLAIRDIAKSSERLTSLVNNLVDISKLESLRYTLEKSKINLSNLVHKRLETCQKLYLKDKEHLNFDVQVDANVIAECDPYYIARTIDNIIINAIQYSKEGTISVNLSVNESDEVVFSVKDEGIGIPNEEVYDVFGAFVVSSKTKTPAGGRGVGLALCKKVIDLHDGKIWAEPDLEKGAMVTFVMPALPSKHPSSRAKSKQHE